MNPLDLLDSILIDWVSPRVRRTLHSVLMLIAALTTVWFAAEGDWKVSAVALIATFYSASNHANTIPGTKPAGYDLNYPPTEGEPDEIPVSGN